MSLRHIVLATAAVSAAMVALPQAAQAHRAWLAPVATNFSGKDPWVTVDAAVSNDLFYADHQPMQLGAVTAVAPDGSKLPLENATRGKYRSTFDVQIDKPGTYRISMLNDNVQASYKVGEETKRVRGTMDSVRKEVPAGAKNLSVSRSQTRIDVFVTSGKPTDTVVKPTGSGLELVAYTHPNDLVAGEKANFGLVIDGKPAAGVPVTVIPGGIRYRDQLGEIKAVTGKDGKFSVTWPEAGMYWMNASYPVREEDDEDDAPAARAPAAGANAGAARQGGPAAGGGGRQQPQGGTLDAPVLRSSYTATLEVLAP